MLSLRLTVRTCVLLPTLLVCNARAGAPTKPQLSYAFSQLAGVRASGYGAADGIGVTARFASPQALALDQKGNLYVADSSNLTIRKITAAGMVSTIAGEPGRFGRVDGPPDRARFSNLKDIAADLAGNLYVTDSTSVRIIGVDGLVATFAGSPSEFGKVDGPLLTARFQSPAGIAVGPSGAIFVADSGNGCIRKIFGGVVTTLIDSSGAEARFIRPLSVVVDGSNTVYVAVMDGSVFKMDATGIVSKFVTSPILPGEVIHLSGAPSTAEPGAGGRTAGPPYFPQALALDGVGNLYIADLRGAVRMVSSTGMITTLKTAEDGTPSGVPGLAGIAVSPSGSIYISESGKNTVSVFRAGGAVAVLAGGVPQPGDSDGPGSLAKFNEPRAIAVDTRGNIYAADTSNRTVRKVTPTGAVTTLAGTAQSYGSADGVGRAARFASVSGVAVNEAGDVFVTDSGNCTIRKITSDGVVTTYAGSAREAGHIDGVGSAARFMWPAAVAIDGGGNLLVADDNSIRKISPQGIVTTVAGAADGSSGSTDGWGANARFSHISGIAVAETGMIYVCSMFEAAIRQITPDGFVTTLADRADLAAADRGADSQGLVEPSGIAVDSAGNVYVSDQLAHVILKISPDRTVTTIGGVWWQRGGTNGVGAATTFSSPAGIAIDRAGNLFVADTGNNAIRKGSLVGDNRLANISTRSLVSTGDNIQIAGFVITGTGPKQILVRASGPALATTFNMTGVLPDPLLKLFNQSGEEIARNVGWRGSPAIKSSGDSVGAFAWQDNSADSALLVTLPPGLYTAQVSSLTARTGAALVEVYDADATRSAGLINISTRSLVSTGDNLQIAGFIIKGGHSKQVLIRACGPVLSSAFKMNGVIADPLLKLLDQSGAEIARNTGWDSEPFTGQEISATAARVGAFAWPANTADSAILVTLPAGLYTAQVTSKSGETGTAMIEVYDADPQ